MEDRTPQEPPDPGEAGDGRAPSPSSPSPEEASPPYPGGTPWTPPAASPPPAGPYPAGAYPAAHPATPPQKGGGSIWLGIGISLAAIALLVAASATTSSADAFGVIALLWLAVPVVLLIAGIVLAVIPRTRRTGGGLLIGMGAAVLIGGGVCVALIAISSVGY